MEEDNEINLCLEDLILDVSNAIEDSSYIKECFIATQDFNMAAKYRDIADVLKKILVQVKQDRKQDHDDKR